MDTYILLIFIDVALFILGTSALFKLNGAGSFMFGVVLITLAILLLHKHVPSLVDAAYRAQSPIAEMSI